MSVNSEQINEQIIKLVICAMKKNKRGRCGGG